MKKSFFNKVTGGKGRAFSTKRGYTLLFAVLTATVVLGVAVFIVDVSRKQYELSVAARNSIYSFYAADSAIECVISGVNWTNSGGFASTTGGTLACGGGTVNLALVSPVSINPSTIVYDAADNPQNTKRQQSGYVSLSFAGNGATIKQCALITVTTGWDKAVGGKPITIVDARGYNLCTTNPNTGASTGPDTTNPATVERALRLVQHGVW